LAQSSRAFDTLHAYANRQTWQRSKVEEQVYREYFRSLFETEGYYDLLLTDKDGDVLFSVRHEADLGTNLNTGPYRNSALALAHREAITLLDTQITQAQPYLPSSGRSAIFIVAPIFKEYKVIGTLALQMDLDKLITVTNDTTGLGKTGETVLAQQDGGDALYVGALRHISDAAFRYRVPLNKQPSSRSSHLPVDMTKVLPAIMRGWRSSALGAIYPLYVGAWW
jgi:hypothetical protein